MGRLPLRLSDLRSLERRSMYSIFPPLDSVEPLPREKIVEAARHRYFSVKRMEIVAWLYLPALILAVIVMGSMRVNIVVAFGVAGLMLVGFFLYALFGEWR
jgi:hypothetical protein